VKTPSDVIRDAIADLERIEQEKERDLAQIRLLIAQMRGQTIASGEPVIDGPYKDMGIVEASRLYLGEHGPQETKDLAEGLRRGGLRSKSQRLVPTVYATLANAAKGPNAQFTRTPEGKWDLTPLSRREVQESRPEMVVHG
jgi:Arc/MetJ-type ribon-helix-helix transcriptional regulator